MSIKKIVQRILFLLLVIWVASTITFFVPRLSPKNPIRERFNQLAMSGGFSPTDLEAIIASYNAKFGLDKPLYQQYFDYVSGIAHFDLGVSLNKYPKTVIDLIMESLPWTIVLLLVTTLLSFVIGNSAGCISGLAAFTPMGESVCHTVCFADGGTARYYGCAALVVPGLPSQYIPARECLLYGKHPRLDGHGLHLGCG